MAVNARQCLISYIKWAYDLSDPTAKKAATCMLDSRLFSVFRGGAVFQCAICYRPKHAIGFRCAECLELLSARFWGSSPIFNGGIGGEPKYLRCAYWGVRFPRCYILIPRGQHRCVLEEAINLRLVNIW